MVSLVSQVAHRPERELHGSGERAVMDRYSPDGGCVVMP